MPRTYIALAGVTLFAAGSFVGWFLHGALATPALFRGQVVRDSTNEYSLINPILAWDIGTQETFPELAPIKASIQSTIKTEMARGDTESVSVYLRLLKSGKWFDINPTATYAPASLLKVFIMTSYFKQNEDMPGVLDRMVVYEGTSDPTQDNPGAVIPHLISGKRYAIRDIIKQMIRYSDNDALNTLLDNFDSKTLQAFNSIFSDLNIPSPSVQSEDQLQFMTVDSYATIFRVLFGATYVSRDGSQEALEFLADTQYHDGIVAGVPDSITVAHKFGVRTVPATANTPAASELHDCGIVYYPDHPYLLCVMTHGKNFASLQEDLQEISRTTYNAIDAYYASRPTTPTVVPKTL